MIAEDNKLEKQIEDLNKKKRELEEKKKRFQVKRLEDIGWAAVEANIDDINPEILLGAFLEIAEKRQDDFSFTEWKNRADKFKTKLNKGNQKIIINTGENPSKEVRKIMKDLSFKWNSFRNEFHGCGKQDEIASLLKDFDCIIDVVQTN